jgi:hypothetical protein
MSNEIRTHYVTGKSLYAVILRASDGQVWNGSGWESLATANWANYDVAITEQSTTAIYYGSMPAVSAGLYDVLIFRQVGGGPVTTDPMVGQAGIDWSGYSDTGVSSVASLVLGASVPDGYTAGTAGAALGRLFQSSVIVASPIASNGDTTLIRGDDYRAADGRNLSYLDLSATWPDNATVQWVVSKGGRVALTKSATLTPSTGQPKRVNVDLTAADTTSLRDSTYHLALVFTLTNGHVETLMQGVLTVGSQ